MTDIIYCLVGPSGSGKTTVAKILNEKGYNVIQSYTTRPPRFKNEWGHTFVIMQDKKPAPWSDTGVIAHNVYSGYHYWATRQQYQGKGKTIYIIDPPGDKQLRTTVNCPIVTIFLRAGRETCLHRMDIERGREQAIERVEKDAETFACVKTDYVIDAELPLSKVIKAMQMITGVYDAENNI